MVKIHYNISYMFHLSIKQILLALHMEQLIYRGEKLHYI